MTFANRINLPVHWRKAVMPSWTMIYSLVPLHIFLYNSDGEVYGQVLSLFSPVNSASMEKKLAFSMTSSNSPNILRKSTNQTVEMRLDSIENSNSIFKSNGRVPI